MTIQETINAFEKYIKELLAKGYSAEKAVKKAYKKYPVMDAVYKETMASLHVAVEEGYEGPLPKGLVAEAIQLSWAPDGLTLSDRTTKGNAAVIAMAKSTIDIAMRKNTARTELTKKLFDGYGSRGILPTQDIPQFMDKLASLGRSGYNDEELRAAIRTAERNIKQLNTRGLQAAYATMVDAVKQGNEKALTKAVYVATQEQMRYLADRIARTERARAYYDGFMAKWASDTDVVAFKWCLSSRHPVHDICDLYAKADLYGLGEGIFPKDKVPMLPAHPHCMCRLKPIFEGQLKDTKPKDNVEKGGKAFIDTLTVREKEHLLGVFSYKEVDSGKVSWREKARGYTEKKLVSRIDSGAVSGALNDKNDPWQERRERHATMYYETLRRSNQEYIIKILSERANMRKASVEKVLAHVLHNKYNLDKGYGYFDPSYDMSLSFQRLLATNQNAIKSQDFVMLKHERLEYELMNRYKKDYKTAHDLANKKHNYERFYVKKKV